MDARGWHLDRQQFPPCLHLMVTPAHTAMATIPERELVREFIVNFMDGWTRVEEPSGR